MKNIFSFGSQTNRSPFVWPESEDLELDCASAQIDGRVVIDHDISGARLDVLDSNLVAHEVDHELPVLFELLIDVALRLRVHDDGRAARKQKIPVVVVSVIDGVDHVPDRLVRQSGHFIQHLIGKLGVEHRLNHQNALLADDDPARSGFRYSRRIVRIRGTRYERIDALGELTRGQGNFHRVPRCGT